MGNQEGKSGSGMVGRLAVILLVFAVAAGGIWGYQQYLASTMPKQDEKFAKERAEGLPPEIEKSNLEALGEMFSGPKPSKEVTELKTKKADEVVFTYDAIMKMTSEELDKNIKEIGERLVFVRNNLPPSIGGATAGGSEPPKAEPTETPEATGEEKADTVPFLALSLEVMRQVAKDK